MANVACTHYETIEPTTMTMRQLETLISDPDVQVRIAVVEALSLGAAALGTSFAVSAANAIAAIARIPNLEREITDAIFETTRIMLGADGDLFLKSPGRRRPGGKRRRARSRASSAGGDHASRRWLVVRRHAPPSHTPRDLDAVHGTARDRTASAARDARAGSLGVRAHEIPRQRRPLRRSQTRSRQTTTVNSHRPSILFTELAPSIVIAPVPSSSLASRLALASRPHAPIVKSE